MRTFNALVPKDSAARQVARGVAYGDGPRRKLDVYAPARPASGAMPTVVFFYGGSWNSGTRAGYAFAGRALSARGFVVIVPDYRLVPQVRYPAFIEDGAAAVRWAERHAGEYGGDPRRIVLVGHSAGAYIAAMLAVDERWLGADRAAVKGWAGLAGPYDFAPFTVPAAVAAFGAWPDPTDTQPITHAGPGDPPALLLTGAADDTVQPRNSDALGQKLRGAGVSAEVRRYPRLGHIGILTALAQPFRGRAPVLDDIAAFIARVTARPAEQ
ncbi:MAG: alpha/beta hydrolase [Sphingomonadaceae bacterium]|nr:alpha/beta hydrolase [Sphingomonadaceae bacterium]